MLPMLSQMPPLLAFGFASPWLLGGLALGAVPVVIHLLHKRKYREVPWAAMRFLLAATKKNARRLRLEQLVLLAVRVLLLLLLALALAQPHVESLGSYFQADVPTHRVLVVDATYSMGHQSAGTSRFDRARELAREIVEQSAQGDALNLVRIARQPPLAVIREPAYQMGQVLDEIDQLRPTDEPADLLASLQAAADLLAEAPDLPQKEVDILSDFQRIDWAGPRRAEIRRRLLELSQKARLVLLDVGPERAANAAVVDFFAHEPLLTVGQEVALQAVIENFGETPLADQVIELHVDGRLAATQAVNLPPHEEVPVHFAVTFDAKGEHRLEVRLPDDALPLDNHRWLALPVRDELNVLLVDGRPSGRETGSATYYVQKVLAPSTAGHAWQGVIRPRVITDGELPGTDLSHYDCVFLCNVALVTQREADLLRAYVESGGGLVVALGDRVKAESYNQMLYRDGKGLLPARIGARHGDAKTPKDVFTFDPGDRDHPILDPFRGNPNSGLDKTMALEYIETELPPDSPANVVLRFNTGDPALVDAPFGRGRVILLATSLDNRWGPWPMQTSFPPILHEMVRYAVSGRWAERQRQVGQALVRSFPRRENATATVQRPDGQSSSVETTETSGFATFHYDATDRAGIYEVQFGPPLNRTELFAVNPDPTESDLAGVGRTALRDDILTGVEFADSMHGSSDADRSALAPTTERGGLTRWLLWAVVGLVFVEQLMAWNFAYGFLLLYALVAAAAVRQLAPASIVGAAVMAAVLLAGFVLLIQWTRRRTALVL